MIPRADEAYSFTPPQILKRESAPPPDDVPMGLTAESLAEIYGVTREEQDLFGFKSQERYFKAMEAGIFREEIFPVIVPQKKGPSVVFEVDEFPRRTTMEKLRALSPAFKKDGTVTAGTSCGRNDGSSACLVMACKRAEQLGYKPLARLVTFAAVGVDPKLMGIGPAFAIPKALKQAGLKIEDMDVIEINEAFAAQVLAVIKELDRQGIHIDPEVINPNGGAIALGHPNGATGARLAITLIRELHRREGRYGLVSLCIGGGQGLAAIFERIE
jgi:acetyl-CoA C-acetyltransferase